MTDDTHREIGYRDGAAGELQTILMRRCYGAAIADVWDACSDPERLGRFFMTPTGDLRVGGTFAFEGNASGEILRCEPPRLLTVTWVYGQPTGDRVELRLSPGQDGGTVLELEHASPGPLTDLLLNDPATGRWGLGAGWEDGVDRPGRVLARRVPRRRARGAGGHARDRRARRALQPSLGGGPGRGPAAQLAERGQQALA